MSMRMTSAPSALSRAAWARPCPRAAPVMSATLSVMCGTGVRYRTENSDFDIREQALAAGYRQLVGVLDGQTAFILGASAGIARASAKLLAADGATLFLLGRSNRRLEATKQTIFD